MPISLKKFENFIAKQRMIIRKIFTINKEAVYMEIFNFNDAESFLVYIPSKYTIKVESFDNVYKIKYLEINEDEEDFIKKETEKQEQQKEQYDDIDLSPDKENSKDLENTLKNNYNKPVLLNSLSTEDKDNIKDVYYQLSRLKLCVQTIKYKLGIVYKNYLCCIKRDNTIECFTIKHFNKDENRKIFICIDLENLYLKLNTISNDIKTVKNGIYKVLEQNQNKHIKVLNNILDQKNTLYINSENIKNKKKDIDNYLNKLNELLSRLNIKENELIEQIIDVNKKYKNETSNTGLYNDIQRTNEIANYEKKIDEISSIKEEIIKDILEFKLKQENIILITDKIMFDNSIMLNMITNNFSDLVNLI